MKALPSEKPVPQGAKGSLTYPLKRAVWEISVVTKSTFDLGLTLVAMGILYDKVFVGKDESWGVSDAGAVVGLSVMFIILYRRISKPGGLL